MMLIIDSSRWPGESRKLMHLLYLAQWLPSPRSWVLATIFITELFKPIIFYKPLLRYR